MSGATIHALPTLSTDRLAELKAAGISVETSADLSDLDSREPAYGEEVLGKLPPEECLLFRDLFKVNAELEDLSRTVLGKGLSKVGAAIQNSDRGKNLHEALRDHREVMNFEDEPEAKVFFRAQQRQAALHATFYWHLGERLNVHEWRLGVRSQGRVVKVERRY